MGDAAKNASTNIDKRMTVCGEWISSHKARVEVNTHAQR